MPKAGDVGAEGGGDAADGAASSISMPVDALGGAASLPSLVSLASRASLASRGSNPNGCQAERGMKADIMCEARHQHAQYGPSQVWVRKLSSTPSIALAHCCGASR